MLTSLAALFISQGAFALPPLDGSHHFQCVARASTSAPNTQPAVGSGTGSSLDLAKHAALNACATNAGTGYAASCSIESCGDTQ